MNTNKFDEASQRLQSLGGGSVKDARIVLTAYRLMRERAEDAGKECDRLRERLAKCAGDLMVADQRIKELEALFGGRASTILVGAKL